MIDTRTIHEDWVHFFSAVHTADGWITPMLDAVNGVSAATASWKPAPGIPSIWEIVAHATGWTEDLLADLTNSSGAEVVDWPAIDVPSEAAWKAVTNRLQDRLTLLERIVRGLNTEELYSPANGSRKRRSERLTNIFIHNAYHTGQIVKLRQLYAAKESLVGVG